MAHCFSSNEFELAKAMFDEGYRLEMDGLGPFGGKTGKVIGFDKEDCQFDSSDIRESADELTEEQEEELNEASWLSYSEAKEFISDLDEKWDLDNGIVQFNCEIGQTEQDFLQWDRCIGDLYVDEDDYNEFVEEHEEFQTKEWHIEQVKKYMAEHEISVEDLK